MAVEVKLPYVPAVRQAERRELSSFSSIELRPSWRRVVRRKSIVKSAIRILAWSLTIFVVAVLTVIGSLFIHFSNARM